MCRSKVVSMVEQIYDVINSDVLLHFTYFTFINYYKIFVFNFYIFYDLCWFCNY